LIGFLANPSNPNSEQDTEDAQAAAEQLGHKLITAKASTVAEIDMAFTTFVQANVGGLVVDPDGFFHARRVQITTLAARHGIPAIHPNSKSVTLGGLMSYASSAQDAYRSMGNYTARILKGDKPASLPVQQSTRVELVLNLKTAKALGLTIPPGVLAIADEVIE
jgi:putative ABC transport system substrate-binding protein